MGGKKLVRAVATPALCLGLAVPGLLSGCFDVGLDDWDPLGDLGSCDAPEKVEAFIEAVDALIKVSGEVKGSTAVACANIATDLGASDVPDVGDGKSASDDDLKKACDLAAASLEAAIDAGVTAGGSFALVIEGGGCAVNVSAQFSCEAQCSVDGSCDPGTIETRCEPGSLSGECTGECTGSCAVEGGSVECQGGCSGTCEGACKGECVGEGDEANCQGKCKGECTGKCSGTCEVVAPEATCSGSCKGGCTTKYTAPICEAELKPPSCDIGAECQGGCNAQGTLEATCSPPSVKVALEGSFDAKLKATIEANFPAILEVVAQGELVVDAAAYVAKTGVDVIKAAATIPACVLAFGANFAASVTGAVEASVSVSVSVEASASVSGSAGG